MNTNPLIPIGLGDLILNVDHALLELSYRILVEHILVQVLDLLLFEDLDLVRDRLWHNHLKERSHLLDHAEGQELVNVSIRCLQHILEVHMLELHQLDTVPSLHLEGFYALEWHGLSLQSFELLADLNDIGLRIGSPIIIFG